MGKIENTHKRTHFANFYLENFFFFFNWDFAIKITCSFHVQPIKVLYI